MTLPVDVAEQILRRRFGEHAKTPTQHVIGFKTSLGRVLALANIFSEVMPSRLSDRLSRAATAFSD